MVRRKHPLPAGWRSRSLGPTCCDSKDNEVCNRPLEEISSLDDYEMSVAGSGWSSGDPPIVPPLPSSDEVANSMYGGTKEIFEQPPPPIPVKNEDEEVTEVEPKSISEEVPRFLKPVFPRDGRWSNGLTMVRDG